MIRSLVLAGLLGLAATTSVAAEVPWLTDAAGAFAQAEEHRKAVLLLFTGAPCGDRVGIGFTDDEPASPGRESGVTSSGRDRTHQSDCELLDIDVLSTPEFVTAAERFVPLLFHRAATTAGGVPASEALLERFHVGTIPTLMVADPWGNEILRMVGRTPKEKVLQILIAMPTDFAPLREVGPALRQTPDAVSALMAAAAFYEGVQLRPVAEKYYERAALSPGARAAAATRGQVAVARGLNLMKMGKAKEAAEIFAAASREDPAGPQADAVLFGSALAALQQGDRALAARFAEDLGKRFPASPYAARLKQLLAGK